MPYIGKSPVGGGFHKLDNLTASATATYALTLGSAAYYPETANQLLVSLNGVIQAPQDSFTVSGSNLIFDSALTASDSIDFVVALGDVLGVGSVTDGAVTTAKIANGAVTAAKLAAGVQGVAGISSSSTSGTALSIDANNIVTSPARPAFKAYNNAGSWQSFGTTGWTAFTFSTTEFDVGNGWDSSSYFYAAPVAGLYCFHLFSFMDGGSQNAIKLRNVSSTELVFSASYTNASQTLHATLFKNMTAGEKIYPEGQTASSDNSDWYAAPHYSSFSGYLIG